LPNPEDFEFARVLLRKAEQDEVVLAKLLNDTSIADEMLGYHLQQAVEKRLKAVLALNDIEFKHQHNISYLVALLDSGGVELPPCREQIEELTPWASKARYEGFFRGELDRPPVPGLCETMIEWSNRALGDTDYLSSTAGVLQSLARGIGFDHVALLFDREKEQGVVHITVDGSAWVGSMDELLFSAFVSTLDFDASEPQKIKESPGPTEGDKALGMFAKTTLEGLDAKQVILLVRWADDFSFSWWHADGERVVRADQRSNSLSKVIIDIDEVADTPLGPGGFAKPDPDVRFSLGMVQFAGVDDEVLGEMLDNQSVAFREKFRRDPGPGDPVFFDPDADEPRPLSKTQIERMEALSDEFGLTDYAKRSAREALRTGMAIPIEEAQEPSPFEGINFAPLFMTLVQAIVMDGTLEERCLHAAVHSWAEGHLAAPGHPDPNVTETPLHVPPFPDPQADEDRLATVVHTALHRFEEGSEVAVLSIAAALAWEAGWKQGKSCNGCAIEKADSAFGIAMRSGRMWVGFQPLIDRPPDPDD
jgi:HEPN domain-containing protein